MDFTQTTNEYYSKWLGVSLEQMNKNGVVLIASSERDKTQVGYASNFKIYTFINQNQIIVSYSTGLSDKIDKIKGKIHYGMSVNEVAIILKGTMNTSIGHSIKFCYSEVPGDIDTSMVDQLNNSHYEQYLEFFLTQHKNVNTDIWLKEYFYRICKNGYAFGIFQNSQLVSVSDAPDMPYIKEMAQEIGINTLKAYQGKGFAKSVVLACIKAIIGQGKCPQWSCSNTNTASELLAYRVGFRKLADVLTINA